VKTDDKEISEKDYLRSINDNTGCGLLAGSVGLFFIIIFMVALGFQLSYQNGKIISLLEKSEVKGGDK
jgi:hypothetical protein